jgi:PAS domain-containing protein
VKFANDAWCKLTGVPQGLSGHVPWRVHVHPDDLESADYQWQQLVEGKVQTSFEWRVLHKSQTNPNDEKVTYLRSSAFPELNSDGSMKTVTGVLLDISVHKAHERAVADRLNAALEAKRAQENFMGKLVQPSFFSNPNIS